MPDADWKTQRAVMTTLLFAYPRPVDGAALKEQIGDSDAVDKAVVELALVGLVWTDGSGLMPTVAARHLEWLELP
jgi:hypothetical protein